MNNQFYKRKSKMKHHIFKTISREKHLRGLLGLYVSKILVFLELKPNTSD